MIFTYKEVKGLVPIWELPIGVMVDVAPFSVRSTNGVTWTIGAIKREVEYHGGTLYCYLQPREWPERLVIRDDGTAGSYIRTQLPKYVRILS